MIETRLAQIITECRLAWVKELNQLQAQMGMKGQFGGSVSLFAGIEAFDRNLDDAVTVALTELGENFDTRNRRWHRFHEHFDTLIVEDFADIPELNAKKMSHSPDQGIELTANTYRRAISSARARVQRHRAGWSAPKPAPWHERHKWILHVAGAVLIYLAGLYTQEVRTLIDDATRPADSAPAIAEGSKD